MSKYYGAACTGVGGDCFDNALSWCERIGNGCTGGSMGDIGIEEQFNKLTKAEFQKYMQASTTKFLFDSKGAFVEVGLFADARLQVGDVLVSVVVGQYTWRMKDPVDRQGILMWKFETDEVSVIYERNGAARAGTLKNPAREIKL